MTVHPGDLRYIFSPQHEKSTNNNKTYVGFIVICALIFGSASVNGSAFNQSKLKSLCNNFCTAVDIHFTEEVI